MGLEACSLSELASGLNVLVPVAPSDLYLDTDGALSLVQSIFIFNHTSCQADLGDSSIKEDYRAGHYLRKK